MLVKHLGFASEDVELLWLDVDPAEDPKGITMGQDPPTVKNFKLKFTQLCQSAVSGDARFLYVDAHGWQGPDEGQSGEVDGQDEGWVLAENDDGSRRELLSDDWLGAAM